MARLKLPKPVRTNRQPERTYLYDPKVDLKQEQIKDHNDSIFIVTESGDYVLSPSLNPEDFLLKVCSEDEANLVSSKCLTGKHAPVIDVDIPIYVVPSSQLGHHHLYIDKEISWNSYVRILKALASAGIIEDGYLKASLEREYTAVRPIGITKPGSPRGSNVLKENAILRKRVRDLVVEVDHLQNELANGVSDDILNEIDVLRKKNRALSETLDEYKLAYKDTSEALRQAEDNLAMVRVEHENNKVTSNPQAYNVTWS